MARSTSRRNNKDFRQVGLFIRNDTQLTGRRFRTLKPIQDVAKGYVEKNVVLRAIAIKDRRKMKKYRKYLARLRERLLASLSDWISMTHGLKLSSSNPCFIFLSQAETWQRNPYELPVRQRS